MYRYIDDDSLLENDETYQLIIFNLNQILDNRSLKKDKELLIRMVKETYLKHDRSIKTKARSNTELMLSTLMSLLLEQNNEIERLNSIKK